MANRSFKGITPHLIGSEFTWEVGSAIRSWTPEGAFRALKTGLEQFHSTITDRWWLQALVDATMQRQVEASRLDRHPMEYVGAFYHAHDRVWQKSQALTPQGMPLLDCSVKADFKKPETSAHLSKLRVEFPDLEKWTLPCGPASQFGDEYYLGQWDHLFAKPSHQPIPSWDALLWLGKDHPIDIAPPIGLLANRRFRENHLFSLTPPSQVVIDSRFCAVIHRRYPWKMDQKLDDVWYNFCLMDGEFDNPSNCAFWFKKFAEEHKTHRDPICFRQAIFAVVCSYWCTQYNLQINP